MNISVCITILNEERTIARLLDSLLNQTKKPDEIVIVDGGSKDKTVEIVRHYQKKSKRLKLIIEKGTIAHGRNTAIEFAKYPIIAMIDAGCIAKENWFNKITEPFKHEGVSLVAGFYNMTGTSALQQASALFHGVPPERFDSSSFLPSARSLAFRKKVWEEVVGFNEKLERAGEDTLFNYQALKIGFRMVRVKDAIVYWEAPKTLNESFKKFFQYARGDAQAGIWWNPTQQIATHNIKISSIYVRYLILLVFFVLGFLGVIPLLTFYFIFLLYLSWSSFKWRDVKRNWKVKAWLPLLQVLSDFAVMAGFLSGILRK